MHVRVAITSVAKMKKKQLLIKKEFQGIEIKSVETIHTTKKKKKG